MEKIINKKKVILEGREIKKGRYIDEGGECIKKRIGDIVRIK